MYSCGGGYGGYGGYYGYPYPGCGCGICEGGFQTPIVLVLFILLVIIVCGCPRFGKF